MSALKICPQCGTEYELDQRFCPKDGSTLRSQNSTGDLVGSIVADRYHILKKLGEGGMGTVYLAEHVKMGRKSAIKVMNPGMVSDADAISRFNREAANASKISHPNVAAVYDFGETSDGLIYLAMEFIEGPSLTKVIQDAGALPPLRAADITRQAAEALSVAHDMGIVHRDLKPDNIMLTRNRDGSDCVKVVDFGIAKAANNEAQKVTKTGMVVGTPEYMSPEQLAGDKLDGRSDTYSLALVAFNMLTGRLPFVADSAQESMILRLTEAPKTLTEMKADTPWPMQVQTVMDRALSREASGRYATASEFGRDLYRAIEGMSHESQAHVGTTLMQAQAGGTAVAAAAAVPKTSKETVPPTRMGAATPAAPAAPVPAPRTRKTIYMVAAAVVIIAGAGIGATFAMKGSRAGGNTPTEQQGTKRPGRNATKQAARGPAAGAAGAATAATAPVDYDAELVDIRRLTDLRPGGGTPATARQALQRLDALPTNQLTKPQRVGAALARAEANVLLDKQSAACRAVQDVEGDSKRTKYERGVAAILRSCS